MREAVAFHRRLLTGAGVVFFLDDFVEDNPGEDGASDDGDNDDRRISGYKNGHQAAALP